jgi:hypothetical protein
MPAQKQGKADQTFMEMVPKQELLLECPAKHSSLFLMGNYAAS